MKQAQPKTKDDDMMHTGDLVKYSDPQPGEENETMYVLDYMPARPEIGDHAPARVRVRSAKPISAGGILHSENIYLESDLVTVIPIVGRIVYAKSVGSWGQVAGTSLDGVTLEITEGKIITCPWSDMQFQHRAIIVT